MISPQYMIMLLYFYKKLGLDRVSLTDETVREIISINVNEDADADTNRRRQRLLDNFYNLELGVLVARFVVAEATLNMSCKTYDQMFDDKMFWAMYEVRNYMFEAIEYWLRKRNVKYNSDSLWDELRNLGRSVKVCQSIKK